MAAYYELLPVFLEMVPGSTFVSPDVRKTAVPDIEGISPELESIDLHCYEREVVILVSGKNLWFARDLQVNEIKALRLFPCAQENAERQIQVWSDRKRVGRLLQEQQSRQKVSVGSCLEVPKKAQTLTVTVKVSTMHIRHSSSLLASACLCALSIYVYLLSYFTLEAWIETHDNLTSGSGFHPACLAVCWHHFSTVPSNFHTGGGGGGETEVPRIKEG